MVGAGTWGVTVAHLQYFFCVLIVSMLIYFHSFGLHASNLNFEVTAFHIFMNAANFLVRL